MKHSTAHRALEQSSFFLFISFFFFSFFFYFYSVGGCEQVERRTTQQSKRKKKNQHILVLFGLSDLTGSRACVKFPVKQLYFPVQTSLWRLSPLIPFPQLGPDSAPTETSWIFPFVLLWTSWASCSWKAAMPKGACLSELNLVQSCSCAVRWYSYNCSSSTAERHLTKESKLGNFWAWFCSGVVNAMTTTYAGVLGQPGWCRGIPWKQHSHWPCPERLIHGSEAGFCTDSSPWSPILAFCELPARSCDSCWSPEQSS